MDFDLWAYIIVGLIVAVIAGFIIHRNESLYSYLKERIKRYFGKLDVPVTSNGIIINVRAPYEIPIGSFTNITATFRGTLTRGFFSCQIVDCFEKDSWSPATSTLRNLDINRQTGVLNFINEKRTDRLCKKWSYCRESSLCGFERKRNLTYLEYHRSVSGFANANLDFFLVWPVKTFTF